VSILVSVLTPSRSYGRFIGDAVTSVAGQTDVNVEHIVQDAQSDDETTALLAAAGDRVRWRSEPDFGQSDALNRALTRARGDWIAWLNADEFYLPSALSSLVAAADETGADVLYGDAVFVDEDGRLLRLLPQHGFRHSTLRMYGAFIASSTVLIRREALTVDPWDPSLRRIMDWDLYLKLARAGARFLHLARPIGAFRVHDARVTARPPSDFASEYDTVRKRYQLRRGAAALAGGKLAHAFQKAAAGAYGRQLHARGLRGEDLKWFRDPRGHAAFERLQQIAYARS